MSMPDSRTKEETTRRASLASTATSGDSFTFVRFLTNYRVLLCVVLGHVLLFHFDKFLFNVMLLVLFCAGFIYYQLNEKGNELQFDEYLRVKRKRYQSSGGLFLKASSSVYEAFIENNHFELTSALTGGGGGGGGGGSDNVSLTTSISMASVPPLKPPLTGSFLIDDQLHQVIDLFMRDYVESWYKTSVSNKEDFARRLRKLIYNAIRYVNLGMRSIPNYEQFVMNLVAHNLLIQLRILKRAKEKLNALTRQAPPTPPPPPSAAQQSPASSSTTGGAAPLLAAAQASAVVNESNLIDLFYDIEADLEKCICRDDTTYDSSEKEQELLQEIAEVLCYSLLPPNAFNCLPMRCLLREIVSNFLLKFSIDRLSDPDYINQTILYLCQDQPTLTENFLLAINYNESIDELIEIRAKIDEEILRTRSFDTGGPDDQEIKLRLSSLYYVRRRIELSISNILQSSFHTHQQQQLQTQQQHHHHPHSGSSSMRLIDDEYKTYLFNHLVAQLDFDVVLANEAMQHCFIEYMGKQNVQNLISFYLNADMYRQFVIKQLLISDASASQVEESRQAMKDFAKGLIHTYLLSAQVFSATTQDDDEVPINIVNHMFYKEELQAAVERIDNDQECNETVLDELQAKIQLLMRQKYFPGFKFYTEFQKILLKNDLIFKLAPTTTTTTKNESSSDENIGEGGGSSRRGSGSSISTTTSSSNTYESILSADEHHHHHHQQPNARLSAVISATGRCNDHKETYAIYIIDVKKITEPNNKVEQWQTYRRFNDFHDLHIIIKKKFPTLHNLVLPGKSFRSSLSDEFIEKRKQDLNRYLQMLCNPEVMQYNPSLMPLMLQFLENKRWEVAQTNFKRRVDSLLTPMISSVQNIQTSIKNAPENVIGIFKDISDNIIDTVTPSGLSSTSATSLPKTSQAPPPSSAQHHHHHHHHHHHQRQPSWTPSTASGTSPPGRKTSMQSVPSVSTLYSGSTTTGVSTLSSSSGVYSGKASSSSDLHPKMNKISLNLEDMQTTNNVPIRIILLLIDEIFDLKEKNQWLRHSLMIIVKSYMKNIKGDSMNRKIKAHIADLLDEEHIARYIKNFRKRMWPRGTLAEYAPERTKSTKELTRLLAKTKLLALVSDDLRHILGSDTTRRGVFSVFDLFQHKPINKRLCHILMEHMLAFLFQATAASSSPTATVPPLSSADLLFGSVTSPSIAPTTATSLTSHSHHPLSKLIRIHLAKSARVKSDWTKQQQQQQQQPSSGKVFNTMSQGSKKLHVSTSGAKSQSSPPSPPSVSVTFSTADESNNKKEEDDVSTTITTAK